MPTLYMLCGKVGSGKSTYARKMEKESGIIYFSFDDYMLHFYGKVEDRKEFEEKLEKCEEMIFITSEKLLALGHNVGLDFGAWKRSKRDYIRQRFEKYDVKLIYLSYSDEILKERIKFRNAHLKNNEYYIPDDHYDLFASWFEEPQEDENAMIIK